MMAPQALKTQLHVPADRRFLTIIQGHVSELSKIVGFSAKDVLALELATEEIFLNICSHAYPDGTPGDVFLDCEIQPLALRLVFRDEGLPFDPDLLKSSGPTDASDDPCPANLGLKLIRHAVDEAQWVNCGRQGKELRLLKWLPQAMQPLLAEHEGEVARAAPTQYTIRPMMPEEALQVARIFWLTYGYSYKNENFYRPEGILRFVGSGKLISFVAVAENGEVAAHAGLLLADAKNMAEAALLVVSPAHRGRWLMKPLSVAMNEKAQELGLLGLLGLSLNPVTSHPASQRETIMSGGKPCGLDLAACPPRRFKAMRLEQAPTQRESYLHCFRYLSDPPPALAHAPERHKDQIRRIYECLERPLTLGQPCESDETGEYRVSFDRELSKGHIRVTRSDTRQWPEICRAVEDLAQIAEAAVVVLDLPLAQPATALVWEQAETEGFVFAGVWPHEANDGDVLRLIRLRDPIDFGLIRLHPGFAQELAKYVGTEMEQAARRPRIPG